MTKNRGIWRLRNNEEQMNLKLLKMMKYEEEEIDEFGDDKNNESVEMTKNAGI